MTSDVLDADRIARPESLLSALRRRLSGRYPVDPFGLDPQLSDALAPVLERIVRVEVHGGEHIPRVGPAVLMMNRGFGVAYLGPDEFAKFMSKSDADLGATMKAVGIAK